MTYRFITDPGHGWLEVPVADLATVGLKPTDFSRFSYQSRDGVMLYLEEDCDATKFINEYYARYGRPDMTEEYQPTTFIRNLKRIGDA